MILVASQVCTTQICGLGQEKVALGWSTLAIKWEKQATEGDGGIKLVVITISGLPPFYDLPNNETKVPANNELKPMQNGGSGAETRSPRPRKLIVRHRKWCSTTKLVSRATVSLKREQIRCMPKSGANGGS